MKAAALSFLALSAAAGVAHAEVIQQSLSYQWASEDPQQQFSFDPFDGMGGMRELTAVWLAFDGEVSMRVGAQTYEGALGAGEWEMEASHTVVAYFVGIDLLEGIGGQWRSGVTGPLGAGSNGQPGTPYLETYTETFANTVGIDPSNLVRFYGTEPLTGFMDGFFDAFVTPPLSGQFVEAVIDRLTQSGTVTLTYEYTVVPTPGALAMLGLGGLVAGRRRR